MGIISFSPFLWAKTIKRKCGAYKANVEYLSVSLYHCHYEYQHCIYSCLDSICPLYWLCSKIQTLFGQSCWQCQWQKTRNDADVGFGESCKEKNIAEEERLWGHWR